ncbi:MAG: TRAP transporter substrate-binding protein [Neoaquamicrobium sediminum]|uniref:TRAP transporter substrate-binding protein n=1 Tax=Neoaquamicrobium sediminum TaxID=1849104 RepID=UPI0040374962
MTLFTRHFAPAAMALGMAVFGFSGAAHAQQEVKLGYALATTSHYGVAAEKWQEVVEAETDGRYVFRHFPSSGLGGEREVIEGVQLGTVEATIVSSGTLSNFVPETGVFDIPFLFRDLAHARAVLDGPIGQEILAKFDDVGLVALAWGEQGFRHITNNRNAIAGPADVAGLKLRTMENPTHITAFEALGAAPTPMAWPEVIGALQQGTIDGQENPLSVITSAKLSEVQKYLTLSGHVYSPAMLLVSKQLWDGMSEEDQEIFRNAASEAVTAMRGFVDDVETSGVAQLKEAGMDVGELSAEQKAMFQNALGGAYEQYYGTYGKDLIDQIIATK